MKKAQIRGKGTEALNFETSKILPVMRYDVEIDWKSNGETQRLEAFKSAQTFRLRQYGRIQNFVSVFQTFVTVIIA